jgi:DNA-binding beta-propeller fold protein YncE
VFPWTRRLANLAIAGVLTLGFANTATATGAAIPLRAPTKVALAKVHTVERLVAGWRRLFVIDRRVGTRIVAVDLRTGEVLARHRLPGATAMALSAGSLWVAVTDRHAEPGESGRIERLDKRTLGPLATFPLPNRPLGLAIAPDGLWVPSGDRLLLLRRDDGHVVRNVPVLGVVGSITVAPSGDRLYVATSRAGGWADSLAIEERDAATGELLARSRLTYGTPFTLVATDDGVWAQTPTGNFGTARFLRRDGLAQVDRLALETGQRSDVLPLRSTVWLTGSPSPLICIDPATQRVVQRVPVTHGNVLSNMVHRGRFVYAAEWQTIVRITPRISCGGAGGTG